MTRLVPTTPHHASMSHADGSQIFKLKPNDKLFKIPRAVIALHISGPNQLGVHSSEPIPLEDHEDSFASFYDAMMTPFRSCLLQDTPNLNHVLAVFALAHKYGASELEGKARTLAIALTPPNVLRDHLNLTLTAMRVMELGREVDCSEVVDSAWEIVSEDFRAHKIPMHEVLSFADRVCTSQVAALAYYVAMLRGYGVWSCDTLLRDKQKQALTTGTASCSHSIDGIVANWLIGSDYPAHSCSNPPTDGPGLPGCQYRPKWVASFLYKSAMNAIPSSDILGRLGLAAEAALEFPSTPLSTPKGKISKKKGKNSACSCGAASPHPFASPSAALASHMPNASVDSGASHDLDAPSSLEATVAAPDRPEGCAWLTMTCSEVACALAQKALEEQKQHLEQHFQLGLVDMGSPASSFSNLSAPETHATGV